MSVNSSNCCYVVARKMAWIYTVICLLSLACPHHSGQRKDMVKLNFPIVVLKGCPVMLIWTGHGSQVHAMHCDVVIYQPQGIGQVLDFAAGDVITQVSTVHSGGTGADAI